MPENGFVVATKNARLSNADRLMEILAELYDISWDVILFTETRRASGIFQLDNGHVLYCSGIEGSATGVAILVNAKYAKCKIDHYFKSDRVMEVSMKLSPNNYVSFVSVYLPHDGFADEIIANTYNEVDEIISRAKRKKRKIIIGGDFQCDIDEYERGSFLRGWTAGHNMKIANVEIVQEWHKSWTFLSNKGRQR